jgi:single-stranded-DNA-specific exonuclease
MPWNGWCVSPPNENIDPRLLFSPIVYVRAMEKRWTLSSAEESHIQELHNALNIRKVYCQLLAQRGILDLEAARAFFRPAPAGLHDPFLMRDMDRAVQRIDEAVGRGEKILIYGDYDVDGTTAVALVYSFLQKWHTALDFYLPDREKEGYGISEAGMTYAHARGFSLVIALDCGIKASGPIALARDLGVEVIVCDHHLPEERLPPACAILNPKQPGCPYPYKALSGCGIGFKLISALSRHWQGDPGELRAGLDLVAASIAADIVPVTGENRILAALGMEKLKRHPLPGLRALWEQSLPEGKPGAIESMEDIVFRIAPRINAAGRMGDARHAVRLLVAEDPEEARELARRLHRDNAIRQELDQQITSQALTMLEGTEARRTTVLYDPSWHKGVIGIVASRVMESCYRPTILLTRSKDRLTGSARSVRGFDIHEALVSCADLLESFGGHQYAAGMTLRPEQLEAFSDRFESAVAATIRPELLIPEIRIDACVALEEIGMPFFRLLNQFAPFGPANREPVFLARAVRDNGESRPIKDAHIRFGIRQGNGPSFAGIGFNLADKFSLLAGGKPVDLCFSVRENRWNGRSRLQLQVWDIRPAELV